MTARSHRAETRASTAMLELTIPEVIIRHVKYPHLAEAASLAALFAVRACFGLTADDTMTKTRPTGYVFRCTPSKTRKAKQRQQSQSVSKLVF